MMSRLGCLLLALLGGVSMAVSAEVPGEQEYQRCAACHLPGGEGVPGAFPPLKGRIAALARSPEGRAYLVAVVNVGLIGSVTVDGVPYMGVMPAQGSSYDAAGISRVLNYSVQSLDSSKVSADWKPFTAEEVEAFLASDAPANGNETMVLRKSLLAKYPELQ